MNVWPMDCTVAVDWNHWGHIWQQRNMSSTGTQAGAGRRMAHLGQNTVTSSRAAGSRGNQLPPPSVTVCHPAPSAWHVGGALPAGLGRACCPWAERRGRAGSWAPGGAVLLRGSD